ncbi:xanthine dehydrogenase family protein molybdopterin-binding subunit [Actinacidiphila acidipaludis]|uniref:Xanthine dehydrogenase family protein molybdopterin-binding subunit n=1 Tax=Actinacidiphila acidipaludis TaxID=2873382 RepID=A0ABS7QD27_9ACTN|nr:xanthine dehydrogenase family protein molybdopterin-binding subunit [Streptomyces acidipaludis]MBY8881075.1 xanthine dehydrogenase family protein molybdopterin-binding subunit [Streptomyces acidipaludis]
MPDPGREGTTAAGRQDAATTRVEDPPLLSGHGRFVADLRVPDCADAAFVRSPVAHGLLRSVDLTAARRVDGVLGAWSAADLDDVPLVPPMMRPEPGHGRAWPALATDRVRYAGEAVAVVVADDRYLAEDGRDAARVSIDALPAVLDPADSAGDEVRLHPGASNVAMETTVGEPVDPRVWDRAAVVVRARYRHPPLCHTSMEARAILVRPEPAGALTVWCSHQAPHRLRNDIAEVFGLPPGDVRVVVPDVGGAFGGKSETWPEYLAVVLAARRLGRPVRWVEDRHEALTAGPRGRAQTQDVRLAADATGRFLAMELRTDAAVGGYPHTGWFLPEVTARMAAGAYATPHVHVRARALLTTTPPLCPYRGAGRPEAAYAVECTVDLLARWLGMDPAELRRRNFVPPDRFPYDTPTGFRYDSGDYAAALDLALETAGHGHWRAEQARRREHGGPPLGIGICAYVERSGAGGEFGAVEAHADGTFTATSGCCSTGQGHATSFARVVARELGVDRHRVRVVEGDTALVPRGVGSFASRSMQNGGEALLQSARSLAGEARERAAALAGVPAGDVTLDGGTLRAGGRTFTFADLARREPLRAEAQVEPPQAFPFGAYVAVVEVDPELGSVRVLRLVAVDDYGTVIDPLIVRGQTYGSIAQGLGQALCEESVHDEDGVPRSVSLLDYLLPTVAEMPEVAQAETCSPDPNTALGAKGAGEAGCIGVPPAVVNAVADALQIDPPALAMPLTPETCWEAAR